MGDPSDSSVDELESPRVVHCNVVSHAPPLRCDFNNGVILTLRNRVPAPRPSHALQIRFEIHSHTFSALKVEQLKVTGEVYKPYKGVRGQSIGNVEWRW